MRPGAVWSVGTDQAELLLDHAPDADWPFALTLRQRLFLTLCELKIELSFLDTDARAQPVGLGWHLLFHKRGRSPLQIDLGHRRDSDPSSQPPSRPAAQPPSRPAGCRRSRGTDAVVAQFAFDHRFAGWRGAALLRDEACRFGSARLPYLVVYTPAHLPFYCVEPVSHVNYALQMTEPTADGLCDLAAGATLGAFLGLKSRPRD